MEAGKTTSVDHSSRRGHTCNFHVNARFQINCGNIINITLMMIVINKSSRITARSSARCVMNVLLEMSYHRLKSQTKRKQVLHLI